jgi:hypothetical protein
LWQSIQSPTTYHQWGKIAVFPPHIARQCDQEYEIEDFNRVDAACFQLIHLFCKRRLNFHRASNVVAELSFAKLSQRSFEHFESIGYNISDSLASGIGLLTASIRWTGPLKLGKPEGFCGRRLLAGSTTAATASA